MRLPPRRAAPSRARGPSTQGVAPGRPSISHGGDGLLQLGNRQLDADNIGDYESQLTSWTSGLAFGADILLYGCDVASSSQGKMFVDQIGEWTGADIAASDDLTGSSILGGDWDFEFFVGLVDSETAFGIDANLKWQGLLATYTVTNTADAGVGSLRDAIDQQLIKLTYLRLMHKMCWDIHLSK